MPTLALVRHGLFAIILLLVTKDDDKGSIVLELGNPIVAII